MPCIPRFNYRMDCGAVDVREEHTLAISTGAVLVAVWIVVGVLLGIWVRPVVVTAESGQRSNL